MCSICKQEGHKKGDQVCTLLTPDEVHVHEIRGHEEAEGVDSHKSQTPTSGPKVIKDNPEAGTDQLISHTDHHENKNKPVKRHRNNASNSATADDGDKPDIRKHARQSVQSEESSEEDMEKG